LASTKVSCTYDKSDSASGYRTGVSLHGHTKHSKEKLEFIPAFTEKWPLLQRLLDRQYRKSVVPVDFSRAYWTSPLTPKRALDLEKSQIENLLDLRSLISLTDHDSIEAPTVLRASTETAEVPISLEWSVPFGGTMFHLGVHNLPSANAGDILAALGNYTQHIPCDHARSAVRVTDLMAMLNAMPDVLVVFNHPLWDLCKFGRQRHSLLLDEFLKQNNEFLHAFELNGMRRWAENKGICSLAQHWGQPMVSGGDRHGSEPSAALNLSQAQSFPEFIQEIRVERRSHVLFMPQYADPMCVRVAQAVLDVIRYYPENPNGTRRWDDRVFHPDKSGTGVLPLSAFWKAPPGFVEHIFSFFQMAENTAVQWAAKLFYTEEMDLQLFSENLSEVV